MNQVGDHTHAVKKSAAATANSDVNLAKRSMLDHAQTKRDG